MRKLLALLSTLALAVLGSALGQEPIKIGVVISETGPAAALGIPQKNTVVLWERVINDAGGISGHPVEFVVYDDATSPDQAVQAARRLVEQDQVVALIGATAIPPTLSLQQVAAEAGVPLLAIAPVVEHNDWSFQITRATIDMLHAVAEHIAQQGHQRLGYIGYDDALGDDFINGLRAFEDEYGFEVVTDERFARTDTSVAGQVLRVLSAQPDAVFIGASGTVATIPHRTLVERGFAGDIYHTHAVLNPGFLQLGEEYIEGAVVPSDPIVVIDQIGEGFPGLDVGREYKELYEAEYGAGTVSTQGAYAVDAVKVLEAAIAAALENASPADLGALRTAIRDEILAIDGLPGVTGTLSFGPDKRVGVDFSTVVLVEVRDNDWRFLRDFTE